MIISPHILPVSRRTNPRPHARGVPPSITSVVDCETTSTSSKQQKKKRGKEEGCAVEVCGAGMCRASTRGFAVKRAQIQHPKASGAAATRAAGGLSVGRETGKRAPKSEKERKQEKNKKGHRGSCRCSPTRLASPSQPASQP